MHKKIILKIIYWKTIVVIRPNLPNVIFEIKRTMIWLEWRDECSTAQYYVKIFD